MSPDFVRRWSLRAMIVCAVVGVLCVLNEFVVLGRPINTQSEDLTLAILGLAWKGLLLAIAIHRFVPEWMEDQLEDVDRPGAKPGAPRFSWFRLVLEILLPVCTVIGLLVPLVLVFLVVNRGKTLTGDEFVLVRFGIPLTALTAVHAFVRSRRFIRACNVTVWDQVARMSAPLSVISLGLLLLAPEHQLEALPGEHPWITLLLTLPFVFDAGYTMLRSGKTRYRSRRAHPSRPGLRRRHV